MEDERSQRKSNRFSRSLSRVLRHAAIDNGLAVRKDGYVATSDLLSLPLFKGCTLDDLEVIVRDDNKQRFSLIHEMVEGELVTYMRANQGHTLPEGILDPELVLTRLNEMTAPSLAIHGTYLKAWNEGIKYSGLKCMSRHHIHFAKGLAGESGVISGMRRDVEVLIYLDVTKVIRSEIPL
jgi:2'-phosphotransferase